MRRIQKQQAEQGIGLLMQAHREIREQIKKQKPDAAKALLEQCQQYAIALGEMIEKEEGEGTAAVGLLEDYCEQIYQIYEKVRTLRPKDAGRICQKLSRTISDLKRTILEELPVRTEAVFLPYKASMWDSLESIWKAACEDPLCDAYVIPIPYYDKNPDGSPGEYHYEGDRYPRYVPVTDYRDYSFQERRPDLIFIHNPYDEYNYLTSVHPFFYAANLRKFTEKLVYVPYFVLEEPDPADLAQVNGISHFCTLPGVIYADNVIVQSEKMRQVYVRVMSEFMDGHGYTRRDWEEKILGLGSPKFDKVLTTEKEEQKLPEAWQKIICKPDGSRKKVILYNTGLTTFLQHSSIYLDKMREVFQIFQEKSREATLLWRPHPLLYATIKTMRPAVLEAYEKLLKEYLEAGFGIYDDSDKLHRAIAVCDAYYRDPSSVVQLCRKAGKPVMLQEVEILRLEQRGEPFGSPLIFENVYDDGTSLWFSVYDYNSLMKMDKKSHEIQWKGIFPNESFAQESLYSSISVCGKDMYFAPYFADEIAVYDMETGKFWKIPLCTPRKKSARYHGTLHFYRTILSEKKIYFLPEYYPGILCYDTEHHVFRCFDDWVDSVEDCRESEQRYFTECVLVENRLVLPCACADAVVIFDVEKETSLVIPTTPTDYSYKFCGICHVDDFLYLVSADGTVSKRKANDVEKEIKRWRLPQTGTDDLEFYPVRCTKETIWLFPFKNNSGYQIDTRTDQVISFTELEDEKRDTGRYFLFFSVLQDKDRWYLSAGNSRHLIEYHMDNGKKQRFPLFLSKNDQKFLKEYGEKDFASRINGTLVRENRVDSLNNLLSLPEVRDTRQKEEKLDHGRKIYQALSLYQERWDDGCNNQL